MKSVLVVGTGTIGEPLIGLLSRMRDEFGMDEVWFHKRTPLRDEYAKVESLISQGAKLVVDKEKISEFKEMGHKVSLDFLSALERADVVIDCTPAGNINKEKYYSKFKGEKTFIAQGSEKGFGIPYGYMINNEVLDKSPSYVQIVSCNTHSIARLCRVLSEKNKFVEGDFVCIRRANDPSQDTGFIASPTVGKHDDDLFGTHHARDVYDLLETVSKDEYANLSSSAMKTNSQYMHAIRFSIVVEGKVSAEDALSALRSDKMIALTHHKSANRVFSFGRDHGFYGRIYNQVVINESSIATFEAGENTRIVGFAFTPQDGNSLLSSAAAAISSICKEKDNLPYLFSHLDSLLRNNI